MRYLHFRGTPEDSRFDAKWCRRSSLHSSGGQGECIPYLIGKGYNASSALKQLPTPVLKVSHSSNSWLISKNAC